MGQNDVGPKASSSSFVGSPDNAATEPGYAAPCGALQPYLDAGTLTIGSGEIDLVDVTTLRGDEDTAASR